MRKFTAIFLITILLLACQPIDPAVIVTPPTEMTVRQTPDVNSIASDYPRVDGSTSAHPLQMYVACEILGAKCEWTEGPFSARTIYPDVGDAPVESVETVANIWHNGTHSAYVNLVNEETDFIIVARMPSDDEIHQAGIKGVKLDIRPIALDAFVFLAHIDNPVNSLTLEQIRNIYTGVTVEWDELGGTGVINAYQRNPNSGSQELMDDLVMGGTQTIEAPDMILESMIGPINAIRNDPLGVGADSGEIIH